MIVLTGIAKNVAWTTPIFPMIGTSNGHPLSGAAASADSEISKDGASFGDCASEIVESGETGHYSLELSQSEMNANRITIKISATNCYTQTIVIMTTGALGDLPANVTQWKGATAPNNTGDGYAEVLKLFGAPVDTLTVDTTNRSTTGADFTTGCALTVGVGDILVWKANQLGWPPLATVVTSVTAPHYLAWAPALYSTPGPGYTVTVHRNSLLLTLQSLAIPASPVADSVNDRISRIPDSPAEVGSAMTLENDAITLAKFDESTAFPLVSADSGATAVARTGADAQTLETLADSVAEFLEDIDAKTTNLPEEPAAVGSAMEVADKTGFSLATTPPTASQVSDAVWTATSRTLTS